MLLGIDKGNSNDEDRDNSSDWEPRVLCLHPHAERDYSNGNVGWDGDEHCTDRLCFYFEFHSEKGTTPRIKLINMLR